MKTYKVSKSNKSYIVKAKDEVSAIRKVTSVINDKFFTDGGIYGNFDLEYFLSLPKDKALKLAEDALRRHERQLPEWERYADEAIRKRDRMVEYTKQQIAGIKNVIKEINKKYNKEGK